MIRGVCRNPGVNYHLRPRCDAYNSLTHCIRNDVNKDLPWSCLDILATLDLLLCYTNLTNPLVQPRRSFIWARTRCDKLALSKSVARVLASRPARGFAVQLITSRRTNYSEKGLRLVFSSDTRRQRRACKVTSAHSAMLGGLQMQQRSQIIGYKGNNGKYCAPFVCMHALYVDQRPVPCGIDV